MSIKIIFLIWLNSYKINGFCLDYWKSYRNLIPDEKHIESKAETFTVEGYNARIRNYLARFRRKSKCYSKTEHMIEKSYPLKKHCKKCNFVITKNYIKLINRVLQYFRKYISYTYQCFLSGYEKSLKLLMLKLNGELTILD